MTYDQTISRDLAALAADNRRAWRTADDLLAALDAPRVTPAAPRPEVLTLVGLTDLFARRVAWIASSAIGILLISIIMFSAFLPPAAQDLEKALLMEQGIVPAIGWIAVPMLVIYALTRSLAARWLAAGLQASAVPDDLARRLVHRIDGWSLGLRIVATAWLVTLFGVLYLAFARPWSALQWLEVFPDGSTASTRLFPLPIALASMAALAVLLARARHVSLLAHPAWLVLGAVAIATAVGAGLRLEVWPVVMPSSAMVARVALTITGAGGVLAIAVTAVLRLRARDERQLAAWPIATTSDAVAVLPLHQLIVRRTAWLSSGTAAVAVVGVLLAILADHARDLGLFRRLLPFEVLQLVGFQLVSRVEGALVVISAAHLIGVRVGRWAFDRVVEQAAGHGSPQAAAQRLADRLVPATLAAVIAGTASLVLAYAMTTQVFRDRPDWIWVGAPALVATILRQVALAVALIVVLAIAIARAHRRSSRWLCVLRHPATLVVGFMLGAWAIRAGSHVDLWPYLAQHWDATQKVWVSHAPALPLLRPALTFATALSSFLIAAWIGLWRCRRTTAQPPARAG